MVPKLSTSLGRVRRGGVLRALVLLVVVGGDAFLEDVFFVLPLVPARGLAVSLDRPRTHKNPTNAVCSRTHTYIYIYIWERTRRFKP